MTNPANVITYDLTAIIFPDLDCIQWEISKISQLDLKKKKTETPIENIVSLFINRNCKKYKFLL